MRPITTQHQDANCRMQYRIRYDDIRLFDPKRCLQHFYFTVGIRDAIATAHHSGSSVDEWMWSVTCVTELSELEKISCPKSCGLQIGTSLASMTEGREVSRKRVAVQLLAAIWNSNPSFRPWGRKTYVDQEKLPAYSMQTAKIFLCKIRCADFPGLFRPTQYLDR